MSSYILLISLQFFFLIIVHYASCQLQPSQLTTMNNLHKLLQNNSKWNSSQDLSNPCSWTGVTCTPNGSSITSLSLSSFSLSDVVNDYSWSSLVCEIETLQSLDLSNNHLASIPPLLLASLEVLNLNFSSNRLTGLLPSFLSGFRSLRVLDLSHNSFEGVIPDWITEYGNLSLLDLSYNRLNGSIPLGIDQFSNLQNFFLERSMVITSLKQFAANYNRFTGQIPNDIGQLTGLEQLLLSANLLTSEIPNSIARITTLKRFSANQNGFTGAIPQGITRYLSNLDLSYNNLNGSIPSDLLSQPNLLTVDLSFNNLEGYIPVNASKSLFRLRLGSNRLRGEIPVWSSGNDAPSLAYLELGYSYLTGLIPPELRLYKNLSLLDLSHNNLIGSVPRDLGDLNKLQGVQLDHNRLSGEFPSEIGGLEILVKLNMSWNLLSGSIPPSLSRLEMLTNLDLQVNNLSGQIPDSFGSMDKLLELQLGGNKLGGVIRSLPTKLQIALNLSSNNFEGPIPDSLNRLTSLEVLDLSNNLFSGGVPSFLTQMPSLTQILLSNNLLTGLVPRFNPNVNVSYGGNTNLSFPPSSPPADWKNKKPVSVGIVVASTAAVVVLMVVTVVAVIVSRKIHRVNDNEESHHSSQPEVIKSKLLTLNVIHRTNLDLAKAMECAGHPSSIVLKTRFSTYYKAVMPSGMSYFVKKVNWSDKMFQLGSHDLIEQELEVIGRLRNSSVMIPLAYALTVDSAYLLYEFTDKGTLFYVLHGSLGNCLDWTNRYSIAIGVANGLAFLHGCPSGSVILLDLSGKAVMLKSLNEPQIGDIELAKAGNVYSFGVILLELLTGKTAVSEGSELAKWVIAKSKEKHKFDQILDFTVSQPSQAIRDQMSAVLKNDRGKVTS
ncbi:hypothetical protein L1987_13971 [Smallanthus sonchifolius]|uniref:Uncharacterized protein n=1 Tax=Smallanthus sonchifolius TaxID=185202 RepID=A0ACB9JKA8_9ASTR|nr:hypothetical protein L1987_13971 [Smallanthus sonchifolius]